MTTSEYKILKLANKVDEFTSADVARQLRVSRQAAAQHLRKMVASGLLVRIGAYKLTRYRLNEKLGQKTFAKQYVVEGLDEDKVLREFELRLGLKNLLTDNVHSIIAYGLTEMVNNAIDHSRSRVVTVDLMLDKKKIEYHVTDYGIGCFENVRATFKFADHFDAIEHLLKGKQTTMPERHSGQGIFFTSKVADEFRLTANSKELIVDNRIQDIILRDSELDQGTRVSFSISLDSERRLRDIFDEYSDDDLQFTKTKVTIKLSERENEHISRSQAKRLLFGLDDFTHIVLDFKGVGGIGQGFADEVFRVYQKSHPQTILEPINMNDAVEFMIKRVDGQVNRKMPSP